MKKLEIIIRHSRLEAVKAALLECGIHGMTAYDVKGFGRQGGHKETYRGKELIVDFSAKLKIEIAMEDALVEPVIRAVRDTATTGDVGDGKIFVLPFEDVVRIRTGERGEDAL
jgi:Nitrogen regulatory protein PII